MAYAAVTHQSAGYVVTASNYNQFADNDAACAVAAFTTKGDLFAATGSAAGARLAAPADYWSLGALAGESTGLKWNPSGYSLYTDSTLTEFSNTSAEQTYWSQAITIPLYASSKNRSLLVEGLCSCYNNSGSSSQFTLKLYYGATSVSVAYNHVNNSANWYPFRFWFIVQGNGATNAQILVGTAQYGYGPGTLTSLDVSGAVDSTASVTVALKMTMTVAHANAKNHYLNSRMLLLPAS